jgi:hypothetical protein
MKHIDAIKADRISSNYSDPQDIKGIMKHIKDMAKLGFSNTIIYLYIDEEKVNSIRHRLESLGFEVYMLEKESSFELQLTW